MLNRAIGLSCLTLMLALPAAAQDAAKGEKTFGKCKSCHALVAPDGEVIAKGGKTGPNLYGLPGRVAGTAEGFGYSDPAKAAGEKGLVWDEAHFVSYLADPSGFLKEYLDDSSARSKMTFRLKKEKDAADVWAYLVSISPSN